MPNRYAWLALGLGAYVAFVLSTFPAGAAYRLFAPAELRLAGIDGTLWSGGAELGSVGGLALRDVRWSVDAWPLLVGRARARAQARLAEGFVETTVSAGFDSIVLRDVRLSTSLAALSPLVPVGDAEGLLSATLERVELEGGWPIDAVGQARIAELAAPPLIPGVHDGPIPLGSYEVVFVETGGQAVSARFNDTGGPLEVSGSLTLEPSTRYRLEGRASARPGAPPALVQGLELMTGEPGADGGRPFELSGSLRAPASSF